jgi:hypothetical protein
VDDINIFYVEHLLGNLELCGFTHQSFTFSYVGYEKLTVHYTALTERSSKGDVL